MQDISNELVDIMSKEDCSSVYALFILAHGEDDKDVCTLQSEPTE